MADFRPLKLDQNEIQRFQSSDTVGVEHGGTGAATAAGARTALGLEIGVDVQEHSSNLDALGGWSAAGHLVYTGTGWAAREIASASSGRITVTNANGAASNPTIDLATVGAGAASGFYKFAYDAYGRVTSSTSVVTSDITALVNSVYVALAGSTMTGFLTLSADPTNAMHAATKQYVDNLFSSGGIPPFDAVQAKTTANINIAAPGATHDGVTLVSTERLLVASQTDASENGIYVFNGAASPLTRATDADDSAEFSPARQVFVQAGTTFANTGWAVGNSSQPDLGTDDILFTQVSGAASYTAGNGLQLTGNTFSAVGVSGQITVGGGGIGLATSGVTPGTYTKITFDEYGRATAGETAIPADIGAQPLDSTLTALAAYNTNGFLVQTAADTFVGRSIAGTAGRVSVTNGNGVSGNPTVDLEVTGITPGTYNSITIDAYGRATAGTVAATNAVTEQLENGTVSAISIGRAVYISGNGEFSLALANNIATSKVVGFVAATSIGAGAIGPVIIDGIVEATTGQWDAVTGQSGGLTAGAEYYLSNLTGGAITTSAPTTGVHAPVALALTTTKLKVDIKRVVIL